VPSVGGETRLQAAARDEELRAVVSEGAGSRSLGERRVTGFVDRCLRPPAGRPRPGSARGG
jgi:hypothetical protein